MGLFLANSKNGNKSIIIHELFKFPPRITGKYQQNDFRANYPEYPIEGHTEQEQEQPKVYLKMQGIVREYKTKLLLLNFPLAQLVNTNRSADNQNIQ